MERVPFIDIARMRTQRSLNGEPIELEAKFGFYEGNRFNSSVPPKVFHELRRTLASKVHLPFTEEQSVDHLYDSGSRDVKLRKREIIGGETYYEQKSKLQDWNFPEYDIRISLNEEKQLPPLERRRLTGSRHKTRYSYPIRGDNVRLDLTIVNMDIDGRNSQLYEVEAEYVQGDIMDFAGAVADVFRYLHNTIAIYTRGEKDELINHFRRALNDTGREGLSRSHMVEARNLHHDDMVYGGLVGGRTSYTVTIKADGQRKLLVSTPVGLWLVYPPFEYNLVVRYPQRQDKLYFAIDGEVVPKENRREGAPSSIVWFLAFDILVHGANSNVQKLPHHQRLQHVTNLVERFSKNLSLSSIISIWMKDFIPLPDVTAFYAAMERVLALRATRPFLEDGLIFTPNEAEYNPHSDRIPLSERRLTQHPDICKWKTALNMTIDLQIKWIQSHSNYKYPILLAKDNQEFRGSKEFPLDTRTQWRDPDGIATSLSTGTIVECSWDGVYITPIRVRGDKLHPNRMEIAQDNWRLANSPITEADLTGTSLTLMRRYHNRIKRDLLNIIPRGRSLLDIGSGRGGDVKKWGDFSRVIAVEPNPNNIKELQSRLDNGKVNVKVVEARGEDTGKITQVVREWVPGGKVDAISIMLSMTFFWERRETLEGLINTIRENLRPGGHLVFFTMDGDAVAQAYDPFFGGVSLREIFPDGRIGDITLDYRPQEKVPGGGTPLHIHIEGTIVEHQKEYLVHLHDFFTRLASIGFGKPRLQQANKELFLPPPSLIFSSLFTGGSLLRDNEAMSINSSAKEMASIGQMTPINLPQPRSRIEIIGSPPLIEDSLSPPRPLSLALPSSPGRISTSLGGGVTITRPTSPVQLVRSISQSPTRPTSPLQALSPNSLRLQEALAVPLPSSPASPMGRRTPVTLSPMKESVKSPPRPTSPAPTFIVHGEHLPVIPVQAPHRRDDAAVNDDTYEDLACTWQRDLVRIATIGDGNCLIHAIIKAFDPLYQENGSYRFRTTMVEKLRRDLAYCLGMENGRHTFWATTGNGNLFALALEQAKHPELIRTMGQDYSLSGMQRLLNSHYTLGEELLFFIGEIFGVDIYLFRAHKSDIAPHVSTSREGMQRAAVVIVGNGGHYETVGLKTPEGFRTLFPVSDPFVRTMRKMFELLPDEDPEVFLPNTIADKLPTGEVPPMFRQMRQDDPLVREVTSYLRRVQ